MLKPRTRYAKSGDISIAYQVVGEGSLDLVYVPGFISNLEMTWEEPSVARFFERLASFSRLILFDKRGTGLSDRDVGFPTLEDRMDDVRAVMDAIGSERAALLGMSEGRKHEHAFRGHVSGSYGCAHTLRVLCKAYLVARLSLGSHAQTTPGLVPAD
jgi:pimeloyl-ACP methyl ester carboxylesterase